MRVSPYLDNIPRYPLAKLLVDLGQIPALLGRGVEGYALSALIEARHFDRHRLL